MATKHNLHIFRNQKVYSWALVTDLKLDVAQPQVTALLMVELLQHIACFSVFLVINNSYLDIQHDYINSKSENKNGLDAKLKSGCGPNSGSYDA